MARIALCDDSDSFRMLLGLQLEGAGHEIAGATGDPERVEPLMRDVAPDVALVDGFLPESTPLSALRAASPTTKFVLYSGMPQSRLDELARESGADAALTKGAPFEELLATVDRLLA
jgi:CheY-like chemotaxis protein